MFKNGFAETAHKWNILTLTKSFLPIKNIIS